MRRYELIADAGKKKMLLTQMRKKSYQIGVYYFFLNAFSLFRFLGPVLVCVFQVIRVLVRGYGPKDYEYISLVLKCLVLFFVFSIGKWLLRFLVQKISGGMCLENRDERIVIDEAGTLSYFYREKKHRRVEKFSLHNVQIQINEEVQALSFTGRILCYEEKKDGSLSAPTEKRSEILVDYYVPGLIDTLSGLN